MVKVKSDSDFYIIKWNNRRKRWELHLRAVNQCLAYSTRLAYLQREYPKVEVSDEPVKYRHSDDAPPNPG